MSNEREELEQIFSYITKDHEENIRRQTNVLNAMSKLRAIELDGFSDNKELHDSFADLQKMFSVFGSIDFNFLRDSMKDILDRGDLSKDDQKKFYLPRDIYYDANSYINTLHEKLPELAEYLSQQVGLDIVRYTKSEEVQNANTIEEFQKVQLRLNKYIKQLENFAGVEGPHVKRTEEIIDNLSKITANNDKILECLHRKEELESGVKYKDSSVDHNKQTQGSKKDSVSHARQDSEVDRADRKNIAQQELPRRTIAPNAKIAKIVRDQDRTEDAATKLAGHVNEMSKNGFVQPIEQKLYQVTQDKKYEFSQEALAKIGQEKGEGYMFVPRLGSSGAPVMKDGALVQDMLIFKEGKLAGAHVFEPLDGCSIGPETLKVAEKVAQEIARAEAARKQTVTEEKESQEKQLQEEKDPPAPNFISGEGMLPQKQKPVLVLPDPAKKTPEKIFEKSSQNGIQNDTQNIGSVNAVNTSKRKFDPAKLKTRSDSLQSAVLKHQNHQAEQEAEARSQKVTDAIAKADEIRKSVEQGTQMSGSKPSSSVPDARGMPGVKVKGKTSGVGRK